MSSVAFSGFGSIAMELARLRQERRATELEVAEHDIFVQTQEQTFQREQQIEAEKRAAEEADKAEFWNDVASVAKYTAVAGSVAAAAFTGGSSLVVAGAIAGGTLTIGGDVLKRCEVIDDTTAMGFQVAGAVASFGAGAASFFTQAPELATRTAVVGSSVGEAIAAGGAVAGGVATFGGKSAEAAEQTHRADAKLAEGRSEAARDRIQDAMARIDRQMNEDLVASRALNRIHSNEADARSALVNAVRG